MNNQITVIEFWRRTFEGREFTSNRLFYSESFARKILLNSGYNLVPGEEDIYQKNDMKALVTQRTIE